MCLLTRGAGTSLQRGIEKVKLASRVQSAQQRAWRRLRAQSTASLVTGVPGSVLSVSMSLALMMELALRRFGGGGPTMGLLRSPRMGRGWSRASVPCLCPPPLPQVTPLPGTGRRGSPSTPPLPRPLPRVTPPPPGTGRGPAAEGALTKHPPAALAQDAGQVLLALGALVPVWDNYRARGGRPGHGWAP